MENNHKNDLGLEEESSEKVKLELLNNDLTDSNNFNVYTQEMKINIKSGGAIGFLELVCPSNFEIFAVDFTHQSQFYPGVRIYKKNYFHWDLRIYNGAGIGMGHPMLQFICTFFLRKR